MSCHIIHSDQPPPPLTMATTNEDDGHVSLAINEEGVGVQGMPTISFFPLLLTLPQAKQPHHLSIARMQDRGALLPTTTMTTTPPSLKCKMEGPYCPPQPQP